MLSNLQSMMSSSVSRTIGGAVFGGILVFLLFRIRWESYPAEILMIGFGMIVLIILILFLVYLLYGYFQLERQKKLSEELKKQSQENKNRKKIIAENVDGIHKRLKEALEELKNANDVENIYKLPWVLLIGESGSGKSTTLRESGLNFPVGTGKISGEGGTENCDWWFSNEAVILDTAGRFTIPTGTAPDQEEWQAFLKMLAKYRSRRPIDSVIVTIPADSLLQDDDSKIKEKANTIRAKLYELMDILRVEFPITIMISKLDLVYGFTEFCQKGLSGEESTQVFGIANNSEQSENKFPLDLTYDKDVFSKKFDDQVNILKSRSLRHILDLSPGDMADAIFVFPASFNELKKPLETYFKNIFEKDPYHPPLSFRGCFFSSGIQQGQSIIRQLIGIGADKKLIQSIAEIREKTIPYFVYNFYRKIFMERGLVRKTGKTLRKEQNFKMTATVAACISIIVTLLWLYPGYKSLDNTLVPINNTVSTAEHNFQTFNQDPPDERSKKIYDLSLELDKHQENLKNDSLAYKFLRTKDNSIVRDLSDINATYLIQGIFKPMIITFQNSLLKQKQMNASTEMKPFVDALLQYALICKKEPIQLIEISSLYLMIKSKNSFGLNEEIISILWDILKKQKDIDALYIDSSQGLKYLQESVAHLLKTNTDTTRFELNNIIEILIYLNDQKELFGTMERKSLERKPLESAQNIEKWHTRWETCILEEKEKLKKEPWSNATLSSSFDQYFNARILEANQQATHASIEILTAPFFNNLHKLEPQMNIPDFATAEFMEKRFSELLKILNTQKEYFQDDEISKFKREIERACKTVMAFWDSTLRQDLFNQFLSTKTWKSFKQLMIQKRGRILDITSWPLGSFLQAMPENKFNDLLTILKNNQIDIDDVYPGLIKKIRLYGERSSLNEALDSYYECITMLPDEAIPAQKILTEKFPLACSALSNFHKIADSSWNTKGERFAQYLRKVEKHAFDLLRRNAKKDIENAWNTFYGHWRPSLFKQYPFKTAQINDSIDHMLISRSVNIITASVKNLNRFFFSKDMGLIPLLDNYKLDEVFIGSKKEFIEDIDLWKDFIFTESEPKIARNQKILIEVYIEKESKARQLFTDIHFQGFLVEGDRQLLKLKVSGNKKNRKGIVQWQAGFTDIEIKAIHALQDYSSSVKITGGDIAFIAFVFSEGSYKKYKNEWRVDLKMPYPLPHKNENVEIQIRLQFLDWEKKHFPEIMNPPLQ
jgi:DNA polymerase III delta prime subunit